MRMLIFGVVVLVAIGGATTYVLMSRRDATAAKQPTGDTVQAADLAKTAAGPHLAFRSTALGEGYGRMALVPLADPGGPRALTPASCDRLYARPGAAICLVAQRGLVTTYQAVVLDPQWTASRSAPLAGLPSRARMSPDGSRVATTTFVSGDSYANPGQFSTRTQIASSTSDNAVDIETYKLVVNGRTITAADRNMWGVTFATDSDTFYATAASGGKTWLVKGSIAKRTLTSVREDVECPSLSPDGTRIAFKKHGNLAAGKWRLAIYDLASRKETVLAEERSVDDQVEWLDNTTIVYGLPRTGANGAATSDIWAVPADGTGSAKVLVPDAWSPAVVHTNGS
jgi:hypothetical protein